MSALVDLLRYATGNGFCVFVGVVIILMLIGEVVAGVLKTAIIAVTTSLTIPKR